MRCWNEYWSSGALWRRKQGIWWCVKAEIMVYWMSGLRPAEAKFELLKRGCKWEWV